MSDLLGFTPLERAQVGLEPPQTASVVQEEPGQSAGLAGLFVEFLRKEAG